MDYISHKLSHQPEDIHEPILVDADSPTRSLTWQEYASAVKRIAVGLKTAGLRHLDCVCLLSRNDIYYWILGDGVAAAGGIICPIASFAKVDEIVRQLQTVDAKWIFVEPDLLETTTTAASKAGIPPSHIFLFDAQIPAPADFNQDLTLSHLLTSDLAAWHPPSQDSTSSLQEPCVLLFSSGTTGHAKAVSLSQSALIARFNLHFKHGQHFPPGERTLHYIAQQHASSQSVHNYATTGAARLYITRRQDASSIIHLIQAYAITRIMVHPQMLEEMPVVLRHGGGDREMLKSLRSVASGGGIARPQALKEFQDLLQDPDAHVSSAWGATEIGFFPSSSKSQPAMEGYVGIVPPPSVGEIIIIDPETHFPLPPPSTGEIAVRGPTLFSHYTSSPSTTSSAFITNSLGTYFRTGDAGHLSPTSPPHLAVTGRYKAVFRVGTEDVMPEEVESVIKQLPGVKDVVVTSTPGRRSGGLEAMAYVVEEERGVLKAEAVVSWVAERLAGHKAPTGGVVFVQRIPRNGVGKCVRGELEGAVGLKGSRGFMTVREEGGVVSVEEEKRVEERLSRTN
ncbi:unnamed protein product [Zymoseptoria tritici ST99CH_3D7]|uniref:AMP-dependent synthetase/ligase domain-containing protein n=1 Tax=Zymoseptoria tritici (strain ST99CH_3D7) TaxID=1276538 RepID=A0A1X7S9S0_ZYMT9|nr:unnamed protein product [Zymoseptoria tritici ST99CH_3D7]